MRTGLATLLLGAALLGGPMEGSGQAGEGDPRVVTLGGSVTETVFALGAGHRVVAVDRSSLYPPDVADLPEVGYFRTLSAEGVLSLAPDLVLAAEGSGPPVVLEQLREAGVELVIVPEGEDAEAPLRKIEVVAEALGLGERGRELTTSVRNRIHRALELAEEAVESPRALFLWGRGSGSPIVAGAGTGAGVMLELAGAENAAKGMDGYRPMTAEGTVVADPEVVVVPTSTVEELGGFEGVLALPGLEATPAGRTGRIVVVDLLPFLSFGPRTGAALEKLVRDLHPELGAPR